VRNEWEVTKSTKVLDTTRPSKIWPCTEQHISEIYNSGNLHEIGDGLLNRFLRSQINSRTYDYFSDRLFRTDSFGKTEPSYGLF